MKKYFIVADVHGFFDEMMEALNRRGYEPENPNHIFVSLGDAFDRGNQAREMLDFLTLLPKENRIFILGNHELLMEDAIRRGWFEYHDMTNGTKSTAYQLTEANHDEEAIEFLKSDWQWNEYIRDCRFYAEIGNNIFVHGWIPCGVPNYWDTLNYHYDPDWRNAPVNEWKEATWINGMKAWYFGVKEFDETIWCGHWHVGWGHANIHHICSEEVGEDAVYTPFRDHGIVAMDACTIVSHIVNCEVITVDD